MKFISRMDFLVIRNVFLIFCLTIFSMSARGTDADSILEMLKRNLRTFQTTGFTSCENLQDIGCVQMKVSGLYQIDQNIRTQTTKIYEDKRTVELLEEVDKFTTSEMKKILKEHGWLIISKFGSETDHQAWLLVQHMDSDPIFQAGIAFLLEQLVLIGETDPTHFPYLYDRVAVNFHSLGLKQKFGTQADISDKMVKLKPYSGTLEALNIRRKEAGLQPIEKYLEELKNFYVGKSN